MPFHRVTIRVPSAGELAYNCLLDPFQICSLRNKISSFFLPLIPTPPCFLRLGICVALASLKLATQSRLASNSEIPCLCTLHAGVKGVHHHIWLPHFLCSYKSASCFPHSFLSSSHTIGYRKLYCYSQCFCQMRI